MFILSLTILSTVVSCLVNGIVLSVLWKWFIVPTLGFAPLSTAYAVGVGLVAQVLTYQYQKQDEDLATFLIGSTISSILLPIICLLVGWIVTWFI